MAFVTRGARETGFVQQTTSPGVGPGAYLNLKQYATEHAYAPFASTKERPSAFFGTPLVSYLVERAVDTLVVTGAQPGGQLTITTEVENYPGFAEIQGPELMVKMQVNYLMVFM